VEFTGIRGQVWRAVVQPESVTVGLVAGDTAALLVDTGTSPAQGAELRAAAARVTDRPLRHVVVTHHHWDHADGLPAFNDSETIAHESSGLPVTTALSSIAVRDLGGLTVEIAHFGPAHTQGDLIVAVPAAGVIFAGDLVETSGPPQFDETSDLDGWVKSLDSLYALLKPTTLVVPGHGDVADAWDVGHQRAGLAAIWGQAEWAFYQGIAERDVYTHDNLQWPWDETTATTAIALAYQELERRPKPKTQLPLL
jgi:glyoxylase-like metal-dependent hydrolase (beta-lactamase superfamily II)